MIRRTQLLVVRSEVQSVIDRMRLDAERPELRSRARDADYRATLERAVGRLDRLEGPHPYVFDEEWDGLCATCGGEQDDPLHMTVKPGARGTVIEGGLIPTGDYDDVQETE